MLPWRALRDAWPRQGLIGRAEQRRHAPRVSRDQPREELVGRRLRFLNFSRLLGSHRFSMAGCEAKAGWWPCRDTFLHLFSAHPA